MTAPTTPDFQAMANAIAQLPWPQRPDAIDMALRDAYRTGRQSGIEEAARLCERERAGLIDAHHNTADMHKQDRLLAKAAMAQTLGEELRTLGREGSENVR